MHKLKYLTISIILLLLFSVVGPSFEVAAAPLGATTPIGLGTAGNFAVLAGSAVNDSNISVITGDVGLSPAGWGGSALTCAEVTGTIYSVDASGPLPCRVTNGPLLVTAKNDLTTAYNNAAARPTTATIAAALGGVTLTDGVYDSAATTFSIAAAQTLTLDGNGDPDSVFIFKAASVAASLVTGNASRVVLTNGAQACNVFWQLGALNAGGSATLGTNSFFVGTILADQSITDDGGSTVDGRFLARIAAVTLNDTTITRAICATGGTGGTTGGEEEEARSSRFSVSGLPNTGGAPIRNEDFPWSLVIVAGLSAAALGLGVRSYRRKHLPKQ